MAKRKPKKPRKGFNRSAKEWEASIARHIGKFIDNLKGEDILNLSAAAICAYAGWAAGKQLGADDMVALGMASSGLVSYQVAKSPGLIASAGAAAYLAGIGVIAAYNPLVEGVEAAAKAIFPFYSEKVKSPIMSHGITIPILLKLFP